VVAVGGRCELDEPLVGRVKDLRVKVREGERYDKVIGLRSVSAFWDLIPLLKGKVHEVVDCVVSFIEHLVLLLFFISF